LSTPEAGRERRSGADRRAGTDRRDADALASLGHLPAQLSGSIGSERRQLERRRSDRRLAEWSAARRVEFGADLQLICPECGGRLEYEPTLSWASAAAYSVDTGYCPACSRRFLKTRPAGQYEAFSWPPLCRTCREPLGYVREDRVRQTALYACAIHPHEIFEYEPSTKTWVYVGGPVGCV
jgi:hypothetical protein